jgi:hypothetical protein
MTPTRIYWTVSLHNIPSSRYNPHLHTDIRRVMEDLVVGYQTSEGISVHSICGYVEDFSTVDLIGYLNEEDD